MTKRVDPRELDPTGGADGDGIVISGGEFTIGPVSAGGDFVVSDGVPTLHGGSSEPASAADGDLWYDRDAVPPAITAADVEVDDSGFTQLVGTDVQTVLDNLDATGVGTNTALVPLTTTVGGVPELVWTGDNELIFVEVTL